MRIPQVTPVNDAPTISLTKDINTTGENAYQELMPKLFVRQMYLDLIASSHCLTLVILIWWNSSFFSHSSYTRCQYRYLDVGETGFNMEELLTYLHVMWRNHDGWRFDCYGYRYLRRKGRSSCCIP